MKKYPTQEELREQFDYHPDGYLIRNSTGERADRLYTSKNKSSERIRFMVSMNSTSYDLKRLVWIFHKRGIGKGFNIYNKSGDVFDNRIENLIKTKEKRNPKQRYQMKANSKTGFIGVYERGGKYRAKIGKESLGEYTSKQAAAWAYNIRAREVYGDSATINDVPEVDLSKYRSTRQKSLSKNKFIGVNPKRNKFYAACKGEYLGTYESQEEAARAYNIAAYKHYGENAVLNDIHDPLGSGF